MAFPFSDIMRVRLARVLIVRVIMRNFMCRVCLIMRGAFSPSKALPTYYARASGPRFEYERVYVQHYARSSLDYARWSVGTLDMQIIAWRLRFSDLAGFIEAWTFGLHPGGSHRILHTRITWFYC